MARTAGAALLAAVEIFNKPTVEYREQTFAFLAVNAWEVLLKARLVQRAYGRLQAIQRRTRDGRRYERVPETNEPLTIGLPEAISLVGLPAKVEANIRGLALVRNSAVHMGALAPDVRRKVLEFGTATVQNFLTLSREWFNEAVEIPYLLPVGFIGRATIVRGAFPRAQREMLRILNELSSSTSADIDAGFSVTLSFEIQLNRHLTGGGNIGITNDPSAPRVQLSDDEFFQYYHCTYNDVIEACKERYGSSFKRNFRFNEAMREIKRDAECAFERSLNPGNTRSQKQAFYNLTAALNWLDRLYASSDNT